ARRAAHDYPQAVTRRQPGTSKPERRPGSMYSVVLLAALSAADGSVGMNPFCKAYPTSHCPSCGCPGGFGSPYPKTGDLWPGFSCWGGCGGYASPAYGVPMTPLVTPPPKRVEDPDEVKPDDGTPKKKPIDDEDTDRPKKKKPKKPIDDDEENQTTALIT